MGPRCARCSPSLFRGCFVMFRFADLLSIPPLFLLCTEVLDRAGSCQGGQDVSVTEHPSNGISYQGFRSSRGTTLPTAQSTSETPQAEWSRCVTNASSHEAREASDFHGCGSATNAGTPFTADVNVCKSCFMRPEMTGFKETGSTHRCSMNPYSKGVQGASTATKSRCTFRNCLHLGKSFMDQHIHVHAEEYKYLMATASAADPRPKTVALGRKAGWSAGRRGGRGRGGWGWVGVERGAAGVGGVGGDGRGLVSD